MGSPEGLVLAYRWEECPAGGIDNQPLARADKWTVSVWKDQQVLHLDAFDDHLIACAADAIAIIDLESKEKLFFVRDQPFAPKPRVALQGVRISPHDKCFWLVVIRLHVSLARWSGRKTCEDDWWYAAEFYLDPDFEIGFLDNVTRIHTVTSHGKVLFERGRRLGLGDSELGDLNTIRVLDVFTGRITITGKISGHIRCLAPHPRRRLFRIPESSGPRPVDISVRRYARQR